MKKETLQHKTMRLPIPLIEKIEKAAQMETIETGITITPSDIVRRALNEYFSKQ